MGIAADVIQHLFWPGKRRFGIDTPFGLLQPSDIGAKLVGVAQFLDRAEELELAGVEGLFEILQKQSTKPTREHAHGEKETRSTGNPTRAIGSQSTAGNDTMEVGMVKQVLSPGVKNGKETDLRSKVFGVGGNSQHRVGRGS